MESFVARQPPNSGTSLHVAVVLSRAGRGELLADVRYLGGSTYARDTWNLIGGSLRRVFGHSLALRPREHAEYPCW